MRVAFFAYLLVIVAGLALAIELGLSHQ